MDGFMRPCEQCDGIGSIANGDFVRPCPVCDGTGIFTEEEEQSFVLIQIDELEDGSPVYGLMCNKCHSVMTGDVHQCNPTGPITDFTVGRPRGASYSAWRKR